MTKHNGRVLQRQADFIEQAVVLPLEILTNQVAQPGFVRSGRDHARNLVIGWAAATVYATTSTSVILQTACHEGNPFR